MARIHHADLWGLEKDKGRWLDALDPGIEDSLLELDLS
jgi:hypothetical protein